MTQLDDEGLTRFEGGAVWHGTATRLSDIYLQLFCDDPKSAEIALIEHRVDYVPAPEVVVLDPPRAGAGREVVSAVAEAGRRKGRTSMPSWDEIVFGARTDE